MRRACLLFSGACTRARNFLGTESGSRFAKRLSNGTVAGSGWNPSFITDPLSGSVFRSKQSQRVRTDRRMKTMPEILMVDDNPADIDLASEVLAHSIGNFHVSAVNDGVEAISFLRRQGKYATAPVPDLVVLDLNLPRKHGCEVLSNIKADSVLAKIPVVIFTTSQAS